MSTRAHQFNILLSGLIDPDTLSPLAGGSVEFYEAGTTTPKNVWTEKEKTNPFTSITLESDGTKLIYGEGIYKLIVKDSSGNIEYTWNDVKCEANNYYVRTVSTNTTLTSDDDFVLVNTNSGNITITLDAAADVSHPVTIKNTGSNNVIVDGEGSETIDGSTTYTITGTDQAVMFVSNGSSWYKALDVADNLVGLTATATEINTACDGITATAAEINTACDGITATASEINTACDGITATASEINTSSDGIANPPLAGDATAGRVLRMVRVDISDGASADSITVTMQSRWNGDSVTANDLQDTDTSNGVTYYSLSSDRYSNIVIGSANFTGNVVEAFASVVYNSTTTSVLAWAIQSANGIRIRMSANPATTNWELDTIMDGLIYIDILYLTDA